MTDIDPGEERAPSSLRRRLWAAMAAIPVVVIPALEWLPWIPEQARPYAILVSLVLAVAGLVLLRRDERDVERRLVENQRLRQGIRTAQPEYLLRQIAGTLFAKGAWRLTVYKKQHSSESHIGDHLVRLATAASDKDQEELGATQLLITADTMFEFTFRANLADPKFRQPVQSGLSPEDVHSSAWNDWRDEIFGVAAVVGDTSTFRARKMVWYAAQDPERQTIYCAIAESADPEGIVVDHLDHGFTPAWLFFVARVAEMRSTVASN
ncbi:hypothetical protein [Nocardioides coralli]|uniref:hypothetical protein n=1 Tax=Nocardioides coralli TaxID=2872154 RepID=UPI001CA3D6D9|nr:hypothetical protein [Nocardioides coralli]QZY28829.1 hypothetical protein K6T13_15465 [Nocardioides coralli]